MDLTGNNSTDDKKPLQLPIYTFPSNETTVVYHTYQGQGVLQLSHATVCGREHQLTLNNAAQAFENHRLCAY